MKFIPKVLLLEDQNLKYDIRDSLKKEGFVINIAGSVKNIIARAEKDHYDASIIDIRLSRGGKEGLEAIQKLREIKPNMYIEVLTAYKEFKDEALSMGADNVSIKPNGAKGLAPRIKRGIIEKSIRNLSTYIKIHDTAFSEIDVNEKGFQSAVTALNAIYLTKCASKISSLLDTYSFDREGEPNNLVKIKNEIFDIMIKELIMENKEEMILHNNSLESDINYRSYVENYDFLLRKYEGQFVAFKDGQVLFANDDILALHEILESNNSSDDVFIKKIELKKKIVSFRRPKRFYKNS